MAFTADMASGSSGQVSSTTGVDSPAFAGIPVLDFNIEEFLMQQGAQTAAPVLATVAGRTPHETGCTPAPSYVAPSILERRLTELKRLLPDISAIPLPAGVSVQRARTLLMHYLIAQIRGDSGNVAVHELAIRGDMDNLKFYADLMVAFKHAEGVNIQNWAGQTALHVARSADAVHVLVRRGALLDVRDCDGETPIHAAARARRTEVLAALLHYCGTNVALAEHKNLQGFTALHLAVMHQCVEDRQRHLLQLMLDARVDVNITVCIICLLDDTGGRSALFHAVLRGDEMTVRELILSGAAVNLADFSYSTPLQVAEELPPTSANVAICALLVENGGFNIPPADRVNPGHTASAGAKRRRVQ